MAIGTKIASAFFVLSVVLCSQSVLRIPSWIPSRCFDPHLSNRVDDQWVNAQIYEAPLSVSIDPKGHFRLQPGLCDLPDVSEDGRRLILRVRANARFPADPSLPEGKGRKIVARDIRDSLLRHADPRTNSPFFAPYLSGLVEGVDAWRAESESTGVSDYEAPPKGLAIERDKVIIRLTRRVPQFPALLSQVWASVVPMEAVRRYGNLMERPVGSGAFRFDRRDALGTIYLKKNSEYWIKNRPRIDELHFVHVRTSKEQNELFDRGDLDVCSLFPANDLEYVTRKGRLKSAHRRKGRRLVQSAPMEISYIALGNNSFLRKQKVRAAMMLALDREAIVQKVFGPRGQLATSPIPVTFPEAREIEKFKDPYGEQDLERARKLLAEAGHPEGKGLPEFVFDCPGADADEPSKVAAKSMVEMWKRIGVRVQLRMEDYSRFMERNRGKQIQLCWVRWYADYPDVENFLRLFYSEEAYNYGRYKSAKYDEMFAAMCDLNPGPERSRLVGRMVNLLRDDVAWISMAWIGTAAIVSKRVRGFRPSVLDWSLDGVELRDKKR